MIDDAIKKINQIALPNSKNVTMPDCTAAEEIENYDTDTLNESEIPHKLNSSGLRQYMIIPETRMLVIDGKEYPIQPFFSIKNAMAGDYKALDYIFHNKGFNIDEFEIKIYPQSSESAKSINEN